MKTNIFILLMFSTILLLIGCDNRVNIDTESTSGLPIMEGKMSIEKQAKKLMMHYKMNNKYI